MRAVKTADRGQRETDVLAPTGRLPNFSAADRQLNGKAGETMAIDVWTYREAPDGQGPHLIGYDVEALDGGDREDR